MDLLCISEIKCHIHRYFWDNLSLHPVDMAEGRGSLTFQANWEALPGTFLISLRTLCVTEYSDLLIFLGVLQRLYVCTLSFSLCNAFLSFSFFFFFFFLPCRKAKYFKPIKISVFSFCGHVLKYPFNLPFSFYVLKCVLVFNCCVMHYHNCSGLKWHMFLSSYSLCIRRLGMPYFGQLIRISQGGNQVLALAGFSSGYLT